jgi:hypothetical protein
MDSNWLATRTKSVIADAHLTVEGEKNNDETIAITLHVRAIELNYGPVIFLEITANHPMTADWSHHPFRYAKEYMEDNSVGNIIDDTPAIRAMIAELVSTEERKFYSGTAEEHTARLIKAIAMFWS